MAETRTTENPTDRITVDTFMPLVFSEKTKGHLASILPRGVTVDSFEGAFRSAAMHNPKILSYEPRLVYREIAKAAGSGLSLDPSQGEGYIVPVWNGRRECEEPQFRVGYKGIIRLMRQHPQVANIYTEVARKKDHIEAHLGTDKRLIHRPNLFGDRGDVVGYYAVVVYTNGISDFEAMDIAEIHKIRDRSDAWKAYTAKKIRTTPWATDEDEMGRKTPLMRLAKRVPKSVEAERAIFAETSADIDLTPDAPTPTAVTPPPRPTRVSTLPPPPPMPEAPVDAPKQEPVETLELIKSDGTSVEFEDPTEYAKSFIGVLADARHQGEKALDGMWETNSSQLDALRKFPDGPRLAEWVMTSYNQFVGDVRRAEQAKRTEVVQQDAASLMEHVISAHRPDGTVDSLAFRNKLREALSGASAKTIALVEQANAATIASLPPAGQAAAKSVIAAAKKTATEAAR